MAGITHAAVVGVADDGTSPVGTNEWNADHVVPHITFDTTKAELEFDTALAFTPGAAVAASFADTNTSYYQVVIQNKSSGTGASTDLVLTSNLGTDTAEYIDLGINSSGYTGSWGGAKDGYLYVDGGASGVGDLVIGTQQANTYVDVQVGGGAASNRVVRFDDKGLLLTGIATEPTAPSTGFMEFYAKSVGGRMLPKFLGPSGVDSPIQPIIAMNKIAFWNPPGNATTAPGVWGMAAYTATGTATARNVATTNLYTRTKRLGYVSASTAGSLAGARIAVAQYTVGNGSGLGGFYKVIRFGCSDAATVSGARQFVGMSSSTGAPTNIEPSTLTNSIGVGNGAADSNLKIFYGGSAAQTPIDLGANFPANTLSVDAYELILFAPVNSNNTVYYRVTRLNTGDQASGTLTGTAGTALPSSTTLLTMTQAWRTNNATALAVGLDIISDYIETDY